MIVLLFLFCVLLVYSLIRLVKFSIYQYRLYQEVKHFPGPEIRLPLIGNLDLMWDIVRNKKGVSKRFYEKTTELCDTYGQEHGFFRIWLGPFIPWIIVCDAKLARKILTSSLYQNKASYYRVMDSFATGTSLFTSTQSEAKRERKVLKEHFTFRYLESYITKMDYHLNNMKDRIEKCIEKENGHYPDINNLVSTFIYDTVGDNLFSSRFTSIATGIEPKYVEAIHEMIGHLEIAILQPWRYLWGNKVVMFLLNAFNHLSYSFSWPALKSICKFHYSVYEMVIARYKEINQGNGKCNVRKIDVKQPSLLDSLLVSRMFGKARSKAEGFIDVMWHMNMFIVAGHDTSTASISWTLYMLSHHPKAQEKVREEIHEYLEELKLNNEKPNLLNLKRLQYLECCIKETLRLYPVAPFLGRTGIAPLKINDQITFPPNLDVTIFYDYIHTQEKYFTNPHDFIPERFQNKTLNLNSENLNTNSAIMPFSLGQRGCLGQQYAMSQMKLFFVNLLENYTITPLDKLGSIEQTHHFLTKPPNFPVQIQRCTEI